MNETTFLLLLGKVRSAEREALDPNPRWDVIADAFKAIGDYMELSTPKDR